VAITSMQLSTVLYEGSLFSLMKTVKEVLGDIYLRRLTCNCNILLCCTVLVLTMLI